MYIHSLQNSSNVSPVILMIISPLFQLNKIKKPLKEIILFCFYSRVIVINNDIKILTY